MKDKLLLLSDLWGFGDAPWLAAYEALLAPAYELLRYDSRVLAGIEPGLSEETALHREFVAGGIDRAVKALRELKPEVVAVLAFSVGGTIAWRAGLAGLKMQRLYAISATRLRYEQHCPDAEIRLYYGISDPYRPQQNWMAGSFPAPTLLPGKHTLYQHPAVAHQVCNDLLSRTFS